MPILIVIEGLIRHDVAEPGWVPIMDRLAATGHTGRLICMGDPGFELFGHTAPEWAGQEPNLPLGYAVALGLADESGGGWPDPTRTWCCLGFTHLHKKQDDLIFLSAERTGQSREECWHLVDALLPDMEEAGWFLYPPSRHGLCGLPIFSRDAAWDPPASVYALPLDRLEGQSFRKQSPSGPYARTLLPLLTVGQMILARHPVNLERQRLGRVPLNTPWIWGVGSGMACAPVSQTHQGVCWTAQPVWAGLARGGGYTVEWLDEQADFTALLTPIKEAASRGVALVHLALPTLLVRHGLLELRQTYLKRVNDQLLEPLAHRLAQTNERLVIAATFAGMTEEKGHATSLPWVMASGRGLTRKRYFWHRGRLGVGPVLNADLFWSMCVA